MRGGRTDGPGVRLLLLARRLDRLLDRLLALLALGLALLLLLGLALGLLARLLVGLRGRRGPDALLAEDGDVPLGVALVGRAGEAARLAQDLDRELARGLDDDGARAKGRVCRGVGSVGGGSGGRGGGRGREEGEEREDKREGLARAGRGAGEDVAALFRRESKEKRQFGRSE